MEISTELLEVADIGLVSPIVAVVENQLEVVVLCLEDSVYLAGPCTDKRKRYKFNM